MAIGAPPQSQKRYPLQPLEFALLIPPELDFSDCSNPELAPLDVALRLARHRFMYSLFVVCPWSAMGCVHDLFPAYMTALSTEDIWTRIMLLVLERRAAPGKPEIPALGSPLLSARDALCLDSYERAWGAFDDLPDSAQGACAKLLAWGQFFHLAEPWCLDWVLAQMYRWATCLVDQFLATVPRKHESEVLESGLVVNRPPPLAADDALVVERPCRYEVAPVWEPHQEQMAAAEKRAVAEFQSILHERLLEMAETLSARGWQQVPRLRNADHFEWLVRHHCNEESLSTIARETNRVRQTVSEPVSRLAAYLEIPPRPRDPGGRRPGAKDKSPRRRAR